MEDLLQEQEVDDLETIDSDSDEENDDQNKKRKKRAGTPEYKKKRRGESSETSKSTASKKFSADWCTLPMFKGWLKPVKDDPHSGFCEPCGATLHGGKSEMEKHGKGKKHLIKVKTLQGVPSLRQSFAKAADVDHKKAVKEAEIGIAAFFADHNVALMNSDHLVDLLKKRLPDSKILQDIKLDRTKCTAIVNNVLMKTEVEETIANLRNGNPYSVLVDESTDRGMKKNLCILIKYCVVEETPNGQPRLRTDLLKLLELDATDCSAEKIYGAFKTCLEVEHRIPVKNCAGLACDNCPTMVGCNNSFWTRLKADAPSAVLLNCICHSAHLVASHSCAKLPAQCKKLMQDVSSYVNGSPKRCAQLEEFQEYHNAEYGKLKKLSFTRWLVLHSCVERYLQIYPILVPFFEMAVFENDKDREAAKILSDMKNPYTRAYLCFLRYVLDFLTKFNALFQSKKVLVHKLAKSSENILRNICQNFVKTSLLSHVKKIDVTHPNNLMPLESIYLGPEVNDILAAIPLNVDPNGNPTQAHAQAVKQKANDETVFRRRCLDFYITAAKELRDLVPLKDPFFEDLEFLEPANALSYSYREKQGDLNRLCTQFKGILGLDATLLALEWRRLPTTVEGRLRDEHASMSVEDFWFEVGKLKDFEDTLQFPQLCKLVNTVLILPHANAEAEGVFSIVTDVKSDKRNRMGNETLNGICITRSAMRSKKITCVDYEVTSAHLEKHNSQNLYQKK